MGTLRFLLALCVVVVHAPGSKLFGHSLLSGITAVQGFYIVSGFLITLVLNTRDEYRDTAKFYLSRYLRLWPAYIVVAVLSLALIQKGQWFLGLAELNLPALLFVVTSNATLFFQDLFLFLAIDHGALYPTADFYKAPGPQLNVLLLVPQAWSLGVELTFYAIAPFVCRSPKRLALLLAAGLLVRLSLGIWSPVFDPWSYRFSPAEMTFFACGGLGYFAAIQLDKFVPLRAQRLAGAICLVGLLTVILVPPAITFSQRLFTMNGTVLLLIMASCPLLFALSRGSRYDSLIGELSYPMYLSHLLVYAAMAAYAPYALTENGLTYVAATIAFSAALLWLVVMPVDRYRRRFGARMPEAFVKAQAAQ
jgi:peptidoglycan/LPS O-acetylase OafA/YrhL